MTLDKLPIGKSGKIEAVNGQGALRRRLLDMGLTPGTQIKVCKAAPMGDPIELELRGYSLSLRLEDAADIDITTDYEDTSSAGNEHGKMRARRWHRGE